MNPLDWIPKVMTRKVRVHSYRYFRTIPPDPGKHGEFSMEISRTPREWWLWTVYEDGQPVKSYETIAFDDARRQPTEFLRELVCERGGKDQLFSDVLNSWVPER